LEFRDGRAVGLDGRHCLRRLRCESTACENTDCARKRDAPHP
jgi:hypothetical protein